MMVRVWFRLLPRLTNWFVVASSLHSTKYRPAKTDIPGNEQLGRGGTRLARQHSARSGHERPNAHHGCEWQAT